MKVLPFLISFEALSDLDEIWLYTFQNWSAEQANRYYELIFEVINNICMDPDSGKQMSHIRKGYRVSKVKSHLIFYKVEKEVIEVIRILHKRMDIENRLSD